MGALVEIRIEPAGTTVDPVLAPFSVIVRLVEFSFPETDPKSTGVAHGMLPFQFSGSEVGVPPL